MDTFELALSSIQQNRLEDTQKYIKAAVLEAIETQDEQRLYEFAQQFQQVGFIEEAQYIAHEGYAAWPYEDWTLLIAELHVENGELDEALDQLLTIDADSQYYPATLLAIAEVYQLQELYEVALAKLEQAKDIVGSEPVIDLAMAELYFLMGQFQQALTCYQEVELANIVDQADIWKKLSRTLIVMGEFEEAVAYLERLSMDDHTSDTLFECGLAYYQLEEYTRAIYWFEELLSRDPDYLSAEHYLARAYIENGQDERAQHVLEQALEKNPYQAVLYHELHALYMKQQLWESLETLFEKAQQHVSDDTTMNVYYAYHLKQQDDMEAVITFVQKQMEEDEDSQYYWLLASAYAALEEDEQAKEYFEKAYPLFAEDVTFLEEYMLYVREIGDRVTMAKLMKEIQSIDPDWQFE